MKKKHLKVARTMLNISLKNGLLDHQKARKILQTVATAKPQGLSSILKSFKRLVEAQLKTENLQIETATKISNQKNFEKKLLAITGAAKVTYKTNPEIVFGARVTNGDWIWEETLESKLKQLTNEN